MRGPRTACARLVLAIALASLLAACRNPSATEALPSPSIDALRFPHQEHAKVACTECHAASKNTWVSARPGHASCESAACHQAAFRGPPSEICALCHEAIAESKDGSSPLMPFPPTVGPRAQAATFSHQQHLDAPSMEATLGFHLSCTDCHELARVSTGPSLRSPRHEDCARCHAPEAAPLGTPSMLDCLGCHQAKSQELPRERGFITGDLHFNHRDHRRDRRGTLVSCATCHDRSIAATVDDIGKHAAPNMRVCVDCHDDSERVPADKRMRRCETCHVTRSAGLRAIAPRSHMPATERPANHTQAFQRDHGDDAREDASACATCHTMLSGNRRDTCDECHQVMEPQDHVITWREFDHGPEASTDSGRCTTCHQVDFCVTCHRSRPRSHFPIIEFRRGGHGTQAIINLRACVTCHIPNEDCTAAGCHRSDSL